MGSGEDEKDGATVWRGERWYYYVPVGLVSLSWLTTLSTTIASLIDPTVEGQFLTLLEERRTLSDLNTLVSVVGWVSLLFCYAELVSRKRVSGWWMLGAICPCFNLVLYLLLVIRHPPAVAVAESVEAEPPLVFGRGGSEPRPVTALLQGAFVCEACDTVLNHGVSECAACGQRYRYRDGVAVPEDD